VGGVLGRVKKKKKKGKKDTNVSVAIYHMASLFGVLVVEEIERGGVEPHYAFPLSWYHVIQVVAIVRLARGAGVLVSQAVVAEKMVLGFIRRRKVGAYPSHGGLHDLLQQCKGLFHWRTKDVVP
jgi:hypothetical protein